MTLNLFALFLKHTKLKTKLGCNCIFKAMIQTLTSYYTASSVLQPTQPTIPIFKSLTCRQFQGQCSLIGVISTSIAWPMIVYHKAKRRNNRKKKDLLERAITY